MEKKELTAAQVWELFERGSRHHEMNGIYENTEKAHSFFDGDQWAGVESDGENLPKYNFIQPTVEHKVASVAMNTMGITYAPLEYEKNPMANDICTKLTAFAARQWERLKMDKLGWGVVKDACIAGESYAYFYDGDCSAQKIDAANIHLADEQCGQIQKQEYIIIAERCTVGSVRKAAKQNGIAKSEIDAILPDDAQDYASRDEENKSSDARDVLREKCTALLLMFRDETGAVCCMRATREVVFCKCLRMCGSSGRALALYPIAQFVWMKKRDSARGIGEVLPLIPNQIETNKMLARRLMSAKMSAFSRLVYNADKVINKDAIDKVGSTIKVRDMQASNVTDVITYLSAAPMSPDARELSDELVSRTRDLAGAGDAAVGQINPEKASGAAIIAVRDQAALPLNEQIADFKQFIEDIAAIWFDIWACYAPNTLCCGENAIEQEELENMRVNIRIDVAPNTPFSKFAQQEALEKIFAAGAISFEEFVHALDENASVPKQKLLDIINARPESTQQTQQPDSQLQEAQMAPNAAQMQQNMQM